MKKKFSLMLGSALISMASFSYAADESNNVQGTVDYKKNGGYEATQSSEQKMPDGATKTSETKIDTDVDSSGHTTKKVTTKTTTTPPKTSSTTTGKKKDITTSVVKQKDNGGYVKTDTHQHINPEGTDVTTQVSTDKNVDTNGNVTVTNKTKTTVDPQGLMNATTTESSTKTVNGQVTEERESK